MNQQKATRTRTAGWKYIVEHNVPVAQDRYSLLPAHLNSLFGNKYCGDKNGNNGLVNKNTDCYLIYGLPAQGQPLLQCLITSIENPDMQSQPDLVRLVHKHLDMTTFLTLADGLVCRAFLPNTNRIHDEALFVEFRKWFLGETSHEYRKRFQLESVWTQLFHMHSFTLSTQAPKDLATIYKKVLREFQLFSSYRGYLAYMSDASIIKNHDHVAPLLAAHWFNPKRFNLLIIQTSSIACPLYQTAAHAMDQEKPTVVLIHQGDYYYEPIHRIYNAQEGNKTNLVVDRVHPCAEPDNRASALIQTYIENCAASASASASASAFDPDAIRIRTLLDASAHAVKAQLLNFKFHVVAFYTKTNVIVPLKRPTPMDPAHASFFAFVDTCLKNFRHTVEERVVKGVFNAVNKIVPGYFAAAAVVKAPGAGGKHVALRLEAIDIIVPLVPYKQIKSSGAYQDIVKDGAIFSIYEKEDKRRNMVSMNRYVEILFQTLKNELVNVCNRVPALQKELAALKHPANPLPWEVKRTLLLDALQPYIKNLVHHSTAMPDVARIATGLEPICSNKGIKKPARCVHQCAKVVDVDRQTGKKTAAHCRLAVPKEHREYLVERCVEHLLNPVNPMEITPILTDHEVVDENIVVFSNADVAMQGIEAILAQLTSVGSSTFKKEYVAAAKLADVKPAPLPAFFQHMVDHDKPSFMESSPLKAFTLKKPTLPPSDCLYELFTVVNRRISAKAAVLSQENVRALVHKKIKSSWRADWQATLARLDDNPCFRRILAAGQAPDAASPPTEKSALSIISDPAYQISTYEIEILAQLLGINVFITTRQTQRMPERMTCLGKQPAKDYYILLHQHQPARTAKDGIDEFYLYVKAGGKYLLTQADLGPTFGKCVRAKCTVGYDQKELEGVCPPYK
jgi:hypothetical protein